MSDDTTPSWDRRTFLKAAGAAAALSGVASATPGRRPGTKENEVLVGVSAGKDLVATVSPHVPADADVVHTNDTLHYVAVAFPSAASPGMEAFMDAVTKARGVKYAEVNSTHRAFYTPDDPKFGQQYAPQMVNSPTAWDTTLGSAAVTIAIVDEGAQYTHPDLDGNYRSNPGYDFVDDDSDPAPDDPSTEEHATHVSGIAAAETDNGTGVAGNSQSTLINGRALNENGRGSTSDIADAVQWATDQGADIINMSLGGGGYTSTMKNAVSYASNNGVFIACAAGNSSNSSVSYPAAYSECVAVSALDSDGSFASYSNYGSGVELCAPGTNVLSTTTETRGSYEKLSGTSMATPVVSGVAGLALAQWNLTNSELRNHLKGTAVDVGLSTSEQGCGRVDAANAVQTDPANRTTDCATSGGGGGGTCGATSTTGSVSDSLSSYADADCWTYAWSYSNPCEVVVDLSGPTDADFDLYVNTGYASCPTTYSYDYYSYSTDSQETITVSDPDTSTDMYILVDSYSGSGSYTLSITEKTT